MTAVIGLALTVATVYVCFRGIAWVFQNGWRSLFGFVALRGVADVEWQDVDRQDRRDDMDALVEVLNEDHDKEHLALWEAEISDHSGIQKYARRMERWS